MFMNARPRPDLNGFRTFVPSRIVELSYHRPYSMKNHGTNTWSTLQSTDYPAANSDVWPCRPGMAGNSANYSNQIPPPFHSESFAAAASHARIRVGSNPMLSAPRKEADSQLQSTTMIRIDNQDPYDLQDIHFLHQDTAMPLFMTHADPHGWVNNHAAADSSEIYRAQYASPAISFDDDSSLELNEIPSLSSSVVAPTAFSSYDRTVSSHSFGSNRFESGVSCMSNVEQVPTSSSFSPSTAISTTASVLPCDFNTGSPWDEMGRQSNPVDSCETTMPFTYDGPPHHPSTLWSIQPGPTVSWSQQTVPPGTISPQALSLPASSSSPAPGQNSTIPNLGWHSETSAISPVVQESLGNMPHAVERQPRTKNPRIQSSSSDPSHLAFDLKTLQASRNFPPLGDIVHPVTRAPSLKNVSLQESSVGRADPIAASLSSSSAKIDDSGGNIRKLAECSMTSQTLLTQRSVERSQYPTGRVLRPRRKLPSDRKGEAYTSPRFKSVGAHTETNKGWVKVVSGVKACRKDNSRPSLITSHPLPGKAYTMQRPWTSEKREVKLAEKERVENIRDSPELAKSSVKINDGVLQRMAKDKFLLDSKREGKSYKQIRKEGGFREAESTLRGRHRTLTKKPEERVRKPEWGSNDLCLLRSAVHELAADPSLHKPKKVSWKEVSDYIVDNGGSYRFGNATCRKKWSELYEKSNDQDLS